MKYVIIFNAIMMAVIVAILPTACDKEFEAEHPYISPTDQLLIDIKAKNYE